MRHEIFYTMDKVNQEENKLMTDEVDEMNEDIDSIGNEMHILESGW